MSPSVAFSTARNLTARRYRLVPFTMKRVPREVDDRMDTPPGRVPKDSGGDRAVHVLKNLKMHRFTEDDV
jgi:hypothetical protein